ncbi:MAG TPA: glycosyltransferase [Pyrinomonadaceae bacterium]|jgi:glycosyltransferase involved in cell wall biosynthesis|nr:glycosyltransferase [Pyrinomonadaceae bacterium]
MAMKRNVLILLDSFERGGAETQAVHLARLLVEGGGGYRIHLACLNRRGVLLAEAEQLGLGEITEYPLTSFHDANMVRQLRRFRRFLQEREIDVVHAQDFYTNVFGMTGAALARVPVRIASRFETLGWRTATQNLTERGAFRLAHAVNANAEAVKQYLVKQGVPARKVAVIYYGFDVKRVTLSPGTERAGMLELLGLPRAPERRFVTIVANLRHEVKNHRMFLRAAQRVKAAVPDAAFVLAGEGELTDSLRALAARLGLERDALFIGRCERIAELLAVSDVCVLSSTAEGFSNSILEYMAAARPVVVTDVGGAREAVIEGETGYLVESGDEETMAARIVELLRDPERARQMGRRGREVVESRFSDQRQLEDTQALYERLLGRASKESGLGRAVEGARQEGARG